jgi:hypothetical protein
MKLQPEQWFLVAVLVLAGGLSAFKALGLPQLDPMQGGKVKNAEKLDSAAYQAALTRLQTPAQVASGDNKIFVSRMIAYLPGKEAFEVIDENTVTEDGITVGWKLEHGFDIDDPAIAQADTDNDGFSNFEEFKAKTNPSDPQSRPGLIQKLRVEKYTKVPFRIEFKGYAPDANDGKMQFQLNLLDSARRSRFVKEGDELEGYKVGTFRPKTIEVKNDATGIIEKRDVSELELTDLKLGETLTLVLNRTLESDQSFVRFKVDSPIGKVEPAQVRRGETFKLDGVTYQLITPGERTVTLKNTETGEILENVGG